MPQRQYSQEAVMDEQTVQRVGIIGAGMIGGTLASIWRAAGIDVLVSSRNPESIEIEGDVQIGTAMDAAAFADVVLLAVPFGAPATFDEELKRTLAGRIVIDAGNPFEKRDGREVAAAVAMGDGSGEWTAAQLPGARVVKAFNIVHYKNMVAAAAGQSSIGVPIASDDEAAAYTVAELVTAAGMEPVYVGPLETAAQFDPGTPLWNSAASADDIRTLLGR